ncbi:MAG: YtxH domain-containing protein [Bacteroidetes bacterium]|nr:YtxH domain-containing protein [Bacteroidota bacterium]
MTSGQKLLGGIILGVAAGMAIALFINSDKGKELIADISDATGDATEKLKGKVGDITDKLKDKLSGMEDEFEGLIKKGKKFISDIENNAKDLA